MSSAEINLSLAKLSLVDVNICFLRMVQAFRLFNCIFNTLFKTKSAMFCDITLNERNKHIKKYHLGIPIFIFKLSVVELAA